MATPAESTNVLEEERQKQQMDSDADFARQLQRQELYQDLNSHNPNVSDYEGYSNNFVCLNILY